MPTVRKFLKCPRCGAKLRQATAYNGAPSTYWRECTDERCNTYVDTYIPMTHQDRFHGDSHTIRGNFGGYGTGKTNCDEKEVQKHIFLTPNGNGLITANVSAQYEQTFKREFEADIPAAFVKGTSAKHAYMDFINNYRLIYRPGDDPDKLRSLNLDLAVMMEASEMKSEVFHQLKTRLRNTAATTQLKDENGELVFETLPTGDVKPVIDKDWRKLIAESNPDSGYINSDILLVSSDIIGNGDVEVDYDQISDEIDPSISSHVTDSRCNYYLPDGFIDDVCKNKPGWWIARYINGSFKYSEGLVYPNAMKQVVNWFEIPATWKRIIAFDYGLSDDARFVFGAIDPDDGILYIYKEASTNNNDIQALANLYKLHTRDIPHGMMLCQPIMDPKNNKRDYNKKDLATHFLEHGIAFKPGHISVDARILRLNTYIERDRVKIMENCIHLIKELKAYKFPEKSLDKSNKAADKPVDKDNHSINPLEWICMELPSDPSRLNMLAYNELGNVITAQKTKTEIWQLASNNDHVGYDPNEGFNYGFNDSLF